jgi:hypothetical protein
MIVTTMRFSRRSIHRLERVEPLHASSHIRSRHNSSATGLFDDSASVCAFAMRAATWSGRSR